MSRCEERHNKQNKRSPFVTGLLLICLLLTITAGTVTLARYVLDERGSADPMVSSNFYFASDFLREGGAEYTIYSDSVTFALKNTDGLNSASKAIVYTLEAKKSNGPVVTPTFNVDSGINDDRDDILNIDESADSFTINGTAGDVITVTAQATSPYTKTLSATFTFANAGEDSYYNLTDNGQYCVLEIYTGSNADNTVTINSGALLPDNTDERMRNWTTGKDETLAVVPNAYYELIFFDTTNSGNSVTGQPFTNSIALSASAN